MFFYLKRIIFVISFLLAQLSSFFCNVFNFVSFFYNVFFFIEYTLHDYNIQTFCNFTVSWAFMCFAIAFDVSITFCSSQITFFSLYSSLCLSIYYNECLHVKIFSLCEIHLLFGVFFFVKVFFLIIISLLRIAHAPRSTLHIRIFLRRNCLVDKS